MFAMLMCSGRAIPASALQEEQWLDDEDDEDVVGETRDDERTGTRYNVQLLALFPMLVY
jgi:hypothetical protein